MAMKHAGSLARAALLCSLAAAVSALLGGCGFRLAGERPLPEALRSVSIELIDPYHVTEPPLQDALQARLIRRGAVIKSKAEDAESQLRLYNLREGSDVLSFDTTGTAIEYRLISRISYELRDRSGKVLLPPQTQAVTRDYSFNAQQILPKEAEVTRLRRFIQDELAELVLLRIEAQLRAPTPVAATPAEVVPLPDAAPTTAPAPGLGEAPTPAAPPSARPTLPSPTDPVP